MAEPIDITKFRIYDPLMQAAFLNLLFAAWDDPDPNVDFRKQLPLVIEVIGVEATFQEAVESYDKRFAGRERHPGERFQTLERVYNALLYCQSQIQMKRDDI